MAGTIALLRYANAADKDGEAWPRELMSDDGTKTRSWHYFLIEVIAEALPGLGDTMITNNLSRRGALGALPLSQPRRQ